MNTVRGRTRLVSRFGATASILEASGVRNKSVWERACGLTETVVEGVEFDDTADAIVVSVRPAARARGRCGECRRRSPRYDAGEGRRRWRALDLGTTRVFLEGWAPRGQCREHGVIVAGVPW